MYTNTETIKDVFSYLTALEWGAEYEEYPSVGKKTTEHLFEIKGDTFLNLKRIYPQSSYRLTVKRKFDSMLDVRFWFEEMNGDINF